MQNFNLKRLQALLKPNLRFIRRASYLLISLACILLLSLLVPQTLPQLASVMLSKAVAQTSSSLPTGIFGGVPQSLQSVVRYAQLRQNNQPVITVPVNGIGNYVLYYSPVTAFVSPGTYQVQYLDRLGALVTDSRGCNGSPNSCLVTYNPDINPTNSDYQTQGVQVPNQPANPLPANVKAPPLGFYGFVTSAKTGLPIANASVGLLAFKCCQIIEAVLTNGEGFYSFYYTNDGISNFLVPGTYGIIAGKNGFQSNAVFGSNSINYSPSNGINGANSGSSSDPNYYVMNAAVQQNISLTPN